MFQKMVNSLRSISSQHIQHQTFKGRSESRDNNFDFLRFALATLVIFSHSYPLLGVDAQEPIRLITGFSGGFIAVSGFFIISGFLIAGSWQHSRSLWSYTRKRFLRIYPGFTVALLFCMVIVCPLGGANLATHFHNREAWRFVYHSLLLGQPPGIVGVFQYNPSPGAINGSLWTIRYEIACYILVAISGLLGVLRKRFLILSLFIGAYALNLHFYNSNEAVRLLTYFLAGVVFFCYREVIPYSRFLFLVSVVAMACCFGKHFMIASPIIGTYLLFYVAFSRRLHLHRFGRYGDFSYGVYLYAFPVQQLLIYYIKPHHVLLPTELFLLALPVTLGLAVLSWFCVEKPSLNKKESNHTSHTKSRVGVVPACVESVGENKEQPDRSTG